MEKQNTISAHLIQFCRFLRLNEFSIGPLEELLALEALKVISFNDRIYFKNALRSTLVKNKSQLDRFDNLYMQYWNEIDKAENSKLKDKAEEKETPEKPNKKPSLRIIKNWLYGNKEEEKIDIASYSAEDAFTDQDFSSFSKDDLTDALRHTSHLVKNLSNRKGRRNITSKRKDNLDFRKLIRKNISRSNELIQLSYKKRKIEKLKLVLICDVSRSMEMYSKFLIQFMYGLNQASTKIETFVFSTRIERITKSLSSQDFSIVLKELKDSFDQWSGGTKIGSSLLSFVDHYADMVLDQKTKVIILSDGWDTGEPEMVAEAMAIIQKKCAKIIWLNPLAANPNFSPDVLCLKAAWPYINVFQAANSVESLGKLVQNLRH